MTTQSRENRYVAVIGAGPAGIFGARELAETNVNVALLNRDIKPGGLAEYGIFHNKYKMKNGLRRQFDKAFTQPTLHYYGNLPVGEQHDLKLADLVEFGFDAILVAVGAQGTKWLGLPGEDLKGVYHAKDLVYHYNKLPPFSEKKYSIGKRVACVGVGNVMLDIANWTIRDLKVEEVTAIARRGPADIKFTKKEMQIVAANLDLGALDSEIERTSEVMKNINQDPQAAKDFILSALPKAREPVSETKFKFDFLASPKQMLGDDQGNVIGIEVEETKLELRDNGGNKAVGLGTLRTIEADTVVFCIGDKVDTSFGLPLDQWNEFAKHPKPQFPKEGISFEAYDPEKKGWVEKIFLAGWAREASNGLVGVARKDGNLAADAILQYLDSLPGPANKKSNPLTKLNNKIRKLDRPIVYKDNLIKLTTSEERFAEDMGLEEFKFNTNQKMLDAMGITK